MITLYRDDDINVYTDISTLSRIQQLFDKYNKKHTCCVIMKDLWESRGVWEWLLTNNVNIGLHGWEHIDYSKLSVIEIEFMLEKSLSYWQENIKRYGYDFKPITTFYPPWNKSNIFIEQACFKIGLQVDIRTRFISSSVLDFHWWEFLKVERYLELKNILDTETNETTIT